MHLPLFAIVSWTFDLDLGLSVAPLLVGSPHLSHRESPAGDEHGLVGVGIERLLDVNDQAWG